MKKPVSHHIAVEPNPIGARRFSHQDKLVEVCQVWCVLDYVLHYCLDDVPEGIQKVAKPLEIPEE